ncbi:hypothetical protein [Pseudodesulfovibrio sp. zrk46]|uniref:hypothetical protein n=1 Tax=Pseudodesulfovibrio sp. zrk46 TaxID=2725288 RepID=UPI001448C82D|nr:hypothetical protein [Pseudodesulfovibrio sp. zrk46]QJB55162.1 hypothetical protein HFN16_01535 [Pseudodesulfovibrio sp. zrk46]
MRHITGLLFALLLTLTLALPAQATEFMDMDICLGRKLIARILCKDELEVNYVSRVHENVYLFSVFYANKEARFFVGVYNDMIRIQGKDFQTTTRSIPYHFDSAAKCSVVDYAVPECLNTERLVCCSEKTIEEELDEKFWDRPIPDLLEEDLQRALQGDNATQPEDTTDGAAQ